MSRQKISGPGQLFSSAFGECTNKSDNTQNVPSRKRTREGKCSSVKKKQATSSSWKHKKTYIDSETWIEKFAPKTKDDLAVHKKKVSEVEEWLVDSLKKSDQNQGACFLLLTGPPGAGKTATIYALSKDLNLEVKEWVNPSQDSTQDMWNSDEFKSGNNFPEFTYESQSSIFRNFLLRANRYPPLFSSYSGRLVLVEEFPNAFLREPSSFHEIVRKFRHTGRCPLVFIVSDCTTGMSAENTLFPKDLQSELCIKNISFNPVAPTMVFKVLSKINMDTQISSKTQLSKAELEAIGTESMGDIRHAINALQFLNAPKTTERIMPEGKILSLNVKQQKSSEDSTSSGSRDSSLFLFHALGKILYCKRDKTKVEEYPLPPHLSHFSRAPLLENPEEVYGKTSISEEGFILFLQQNYLSFVEDIKVAVECASWLSDSEALTAEWSERFTLNSYSASLATRGLMFNLTPCSSGNRWRPLHKPKYFSSTKDNNKLCQSVKHAFRGKQLSLRELQIDFLPFLSKIAPPSVHNNEIKHIVNQLDTLNLRSAHRLQSDSLFEKELCEIDVHDLQHYPEVEKDFMSEDNPPISEPCMQDTADEFLIEEFDV